MKERTPYLTGKTLNENEDERYDKYKYSTEDGSIYEHCIKAIESVWLGFFLYNVLARFTKIMEKVKDNNSENKNIQENELLEKQNNELKEENKIEKYKDVMQQLKKALNTNGWDGRWYKRAFMDDGNILGSMANDECRIDSIAQSWSTISNAGDNDKKYISMESLENHLIDRENGIIKLLDPPFEKGKLEPGYIKAYLPGVRENGGQYTQECYC